MASIEKAGGVHAKERLQTSKKSKTNLQKYTEYHDLDNHPYVESDEVEDRGTGKVVIIDGNE